MRMSCRLRLLRSSRSKCSTVSYGELTARNDDVEEDEEDEDREGDDCSMHHCCCLMGFW
jgi:hypothetical protein